MVTLAGASSYTASKLNKDDSVTTDALERIWKEPERYIIGSMEVLLDKSNNEKPLGE